MAKKRKLRELRKELIDDKKMRDIMEAAVEYADTRPKLGVLKLKRDKSSYKKTNK